MTAVVDLLGKAVTDIRDDPAVAAITTRVRGGELAADDVPPAVVVVKLLPNLNPFGNTRRAGLQQPLYAAHCYGATYQQAAQVAGAVMGAVNARGPRPRDVSGRVVFLSLVEGGGGATKDPTTGWPVEDVTFTYTGAQAPIA